jgi:mycothiol synthase
MPVSFPEGYPLRAATPGDAQGIIDLVAACDMADYGEAQPMTEEDVAQWFQRATTMRVLTDAAGAIAALSVLDDQDHIEFYADGYVHPDHTGRGIGAALIALAEETARELFPLAPPDAQIILRNGVTQKNTAAQAINTAAGMRPVRYFWRMRIDQTEPPPPAEWPEGITWRAFVPNQDEQVVYETVETAFEDHWGYHRTPYDEFAQRFSRSDFDPSLWFLAFSGGALAGVTLGKPEGAGGWINKVAVLREFRKRGVAMALLRTAFAEFYRRGRLRVELGVDAASPTGAQRLYEQAGMRVAAEYVIYEKVIRSGVVAAHAE